MKEKSSSQLLFKLRTATTELASIWDGESARTLVVPDADEWKERCIVKDTHIPMMF